MRPSEEAYEMQVTKGKEKVEGGKRDTDKGASGRKSSSSGSSDSFTSTSTEDRLLYTTTSEEEAVVPKPSTPPRVSSDPIASWVIPTDWPHGYDYPSSNMADSSITPQEVSRSSPTRDDTMIKAVSKNSRFRFLINLKILSFFIQALLSVSVVCYCLVWMAMEQFDDEVMGHLLPLLTFVLGVWLPNPAEILKQRMSRSGNSRRKRRRSARSSYD